MLAVMAERPGCCVAPHGRHIPAELGRPAYPSHRRTRARVRIARPGEGELVGGQWIVRRSGYVDLLYGYCGAMLRRDFLPPKSSISRLWPGRSTRSGFPAISNVSAARSGPMRAYPAHGSARCDEQGPLLAAVIDNHDRRSATARRCTTSGRPMGSGNPPRPSGSSVCPNRSGMVSGRSSSLPHTDPPVSPDPDPRPFPRFKLG